MNFLVTLSDSGTQVNKLINANSWSSCLAYCEGTGFDITIISLLASNVNVVLDVPSSQNCYNVFLKSTITNTPSNYFVFTTDFTTLETWINAQADMAVQNIALTQKSYVTV